jgi:hypothetical protein
MIYLNLGKVGSGKTLLSLTQILSILAKGGCVVTNIKLMEAGVDAYLWKYYKRRLGKGQIRFHDFEAQPDFRRAVPRGVPGLNVHVFCDEAQLYYNSAQDLQLKKELLKLVSYLTQSRKMCVDVTFITQAAETLWSQFRYQALFAWKCRDMRVLSVPLFGKIFSGLKYSQLDILSGEVLGRFGTKLHKDLFACYDTRQMYDAEMTDIFENAEVWEPLPKNHTQYPDALTCHYCNRHRSRCLCRQSPWRLFRQGRPREASSGTDGRASAEGGEAGLADGGSGAV